MSRTHVSAAVLAIAGVVLFVVGMLSWETGSPDWSWERIVLPAIAGVTLIAIAVALEAVKYTSDMPPVE